MFLNRRQNASSSSSHSEIYTWNKQEATTDVLYNALCTDMFFTYSQSSPSFNSKASEKKWISHQVSQESLISSFFHLHMLHLIVLKYTFSSSGILSLSHSERVLLKSCSFRTFSIATNTKQAHEKLITQQTEISATKFLCHIQECFNTVRLQPTVSSDARHINPCCHFQKTTAFV